MLPFYEKFGKHDLPEKLKDEILGIDGNKLKVIDNLNHVNIIVGPNNTGKSLVIREMLRSKSKSYYSDIRWAEIQSELLFIKKALNELLALDYISEPFVFAETNGNQYINTFDLASRFEQFCTYNPDFSVESITSFLDQSFNRDYSFIHGTNYYIQTTNGRVYFNQEDTSHIAKGILGKLDSLKKEALDVIERLSKLSLLNANSYSTRIYVPSIRTLRPYSNSAGLTKVTAHEYKFDTEAIEIKNGQEIPELIFQKKNADYIDGRLISQFEDFLSEEFFETEKVLLTYHKDKHILQIKIGNEKQLPISYLGDGLQMVIILTFPFFQYDGGVIAIEEPELFIHPALQKTFVKFLLSHPKTKNWQVFLTTHSNHIIDAVNYTDKISIFSIRKQKKQIDQEEEIPDFIIENLAYGNENLLSLLGITNTSVYLSNCVIWVEGVTDRLYLQRMLLEYLNNPNLDAKYTDAKNYKEGIHYSFAYSGGDNIVHWDFSDESEYDETVNSVIVRKFCAKSLVIVDNDFMKNVKRKEHLERLLGNRFIELPCPEIENLLSVEVVKNTLLQFPSVGKHYEFSDFAELDQEGIKSSRIGNLIDTILNKQNKVKQFAEVGGNGSLKPGDKLHFCKRSLPFIKQNNMPDYTKEIIERILDFVIAQN